MNGNTNILDSKQRILQNPELPEAGLPYFLIEGKETNTSYSTSKDEIRILLKSGKVVPMSQLSDTAIQQRMFTKYYLCYPKSAKPPMEADSQP